MNIHIIKAIMHSKRCVLTIASFNLKTPMSTAQYSKGHYPHLEDIFQYFYHYYDKTACFKTEQKRGVHRYIKIIFQ